MIPADGGDREHDDRGECEDREPTSAVVQQLGKSYRGEPDCRHSAENYEPGGPDQRERKAGEGNCVRIASIGRDVA